MAKKKNVNPYDLSDFESALEARLKAVAEGEGIGNPEDLTLPGNPVELAPPVLPAEEWAAKAADRAVAAADEWLKRVMRPRRHPVEAAIAADKKRKDRLAEAERKGKWVAAMKQVDVDEMYKTIEAVGSAGFAAGIEARRGKIVKKISKLQPLVSALKEEIQKMPEETDAQREKRMLAARRGMLKIGDILRGIKPPAGT
jgi:hypothetical protein